MHREWTRYVANTLGAAVNYAVYAASLFTLDIVRAHLALGVAAGAPAGLGFNFIACKLWLLPQQTRDPQGSKHALVSDRYPGPCAGWTVLRRDALARALVEQMDRAGVRRQGDLVARAELVPLLEHHRDLLTRHAREHEDLGAGRLDHDDLGGQAAAGIGQVEMLGPDAVDHLLAVPAAGLPGQRQRRTVLRSPPSARRRCA